jgi:hypothetical protein
MGHDIEEVNVLNSAVAFPVVFLHEAEHFLLFDVKAEGTHGNLQFVVVNGASLISVEEVECLLNLLFLLFSELSALTAFALSRLHLLLAGFLLSEEVRLFVHFGLNL